MAALSQEVKECFLEEGTSKLRSESKWGLAGQREEDATEFHTHKVLGPGTEVRSGKKQVWKVGRGSWRKGLVCCLRNLDFVWREIGS